MCYFLQKFCLYAGILVDFLFHFTEKLYLDATQVMELINSDELENVSFKLAIYSDADLV